MSESQEVEVDFSDLARGRMYTAPIRSLLPDSPVIWRDSLNFCPREGLMRRRPALSSLEGRAIGLPPSAYGLRALTNGQRPVFVYSSTSATHTNFSSLTGGLNGTTAYRSYTGSATISVVVTNRQIFISNDLTSGFVDCTPLYSTGTIAVTNGSPNIVGTGTAWATRGISPFQQIKIGSTWYQISVVTDDTHITLSTNFAGATAGGLAYTIERTFGMGNSNGSDKSSQVFCTLYNQSLYVAGTFVGRADGVPTPTVIKVSNIFSSSPTTTYLTSSFALVSGLDTIAATDISGVAVLQDSRVVVSADNATAYYSSNLTDTVWTSSPGGFSVIEHKSGSILALGWLSSKLTFHFSDGIVFGIPNGQSDPPLNFLDSDATEGCSAPHTLREWQGKQYFMGYDGNVYIFDSHSTIPIGDDIKSDGNISQLSPDILRNNCFSNFNHKYQEYCLYIYPSDLLSTHGFIFHDGSWFPVQYPVPIGAVSDLDCVTGNNYYALAGVYSLDGSTENYMLWGLKSSLGVTQDDKIYSGASIGGYYLTTDDLDFQNPLIYKTIVSVVGWFRGESDLPNDQIYIEASRDGGRTWVAASTKTPSPYSVGEKPIQWSFIDLINAGLTLRFRISSPTANAYSIIPTRLRITAIQLGDAGLTSL